MTTRNQVARWRALADAATQGWDEQREFLANCGEAVPAMAAMLERAADVIAALLATTEGEPGDALAWLREWRGDPAAGEEGANG